MHSRSSREIPSTSLQGRLFTLPENGSAQEDSHQKRLLFV
jgi:hypothetical protein